MSLQNFIKYLEAIVSILPLIEKVIEFIEMIFKKLNIVKGGEVKKALAINILKEETEIPEDILSHTIDTIVEAKNYKKDFTHSSY